MPPLLGGGYFGVGISDITWSFFVTQKSISLGFLANVQGSHSTNESSKLSVSHSLSSHVGQHKNGKKKV